MYIQCNYEYTEKIFIFIKNESKSWLLKTIILVSFITLIPFSLTAQDITTGLIGYYRFNGNANDEINNNNGVVNGPTLTTDMYGNSSKCYQFDGINDWINTIDTNFRTIYNDFTMSIWAFPNSARTVTTQSTTGASGICCQRYAIFPEHGEWLFGAGHAGAGISIGTNGVSVFEHADNYLPSLIVYNVTIDCWIHVVVSYINRQPRLYINGSLVSTGPTSNKSYIHPSSDFGDHNDPRSPSNTYQYGFYSGKIDNYRIYNRSLSSNDIKYLYEYELGNFLSADNNRIDLGNIICMSEITKSINLNNSGDFSINVTGLEFLDGTRFQISNGTSFSISSEDSRQVYIKFSTNQTGTFYDTLLVELDGCLPIKRIPISGTKDSINFALNNTYPDTLDIDLGVVCPGSIKDTTFTIQNKSTISTTLGFGSLALPFSVEGVSAAKKEEEYEGEK